MRKLLATLALTIALAMAIALAIPAAAKAQFLNGPPGEDQLTPEIMATQPRLDERDVSLFVDLFKGILAGSSEQSDIATFARVHGVSMLRLNYVAVKIVFPYVSDISRSSIMKELGLGILLNAEEKALLEKSEKEIAPIMAIFQNGL